MSQYYTFLAIIPARGGSKGLPGKNIIELAGKPLVVWSIESSLSSKYITKTIVSSDSNKILEISKQFGAEPIKRPALLASDTAASEPLITHVIEQLQKKGEFYDFIVLLQPTSPLRNAKDIDDAIALMFVEKADALISVYEPEHSPYKAFKVNDYGYLSGLIDNETPFKRRQDLPTVYMPNGAIYIVKTERFLENKRLFTEKTIPFPMSFEKSIDIDTIEDLKKIEKILEEKKKVKNEAV